MSPLEKIEHLGPCPEAVKWLAEQPSAAEAWRTCERGDWMLWLLGRIAGQVGSKSRKRLVLAACACARLALKHVPKGEDRPRKAIIAAERYARGTHGVTLEDVRNAYSAASVYSAAFAHSATYAYYSYSAASAAYAACAYGADRGTTLRLCADIVRKHYPKPPRIRMESRA